MTATTRTGDAITELAVEKEEASAGDVEEGRKDLEAAAGKASSASPDQMAEIFEEMQRNPDLQKLVDMGVMKWQDLYDEVDGKPVLDYAKIQSIVQKLRKENASLSAKTVQSFQQMAVPGMKPSALMPGLSIWSGPKFFPPTVLG